MSKSALIAIALTGLLAGATAPPIPPSRYAAVAYGPVQKEPDFAGAGPDDGPNLCLMFKTTFLTQTNWIYRLEWTPDLTHWLPCQPEIDGTGEDDYFFDVNQGCRSYRIVARPGQLTKSLSFLWDPSSQATDYRFYELIYQDRTLLGTSPTGGIVIADLDATMSHTFTVTATNVTGESGQAVPLFVP